MKLTFIDFEDSFTNNILAFISLWKDVELIVLNYKKVDVGHFQDANIILGPGPGHPSEYIEFFKNNNIDLKQILLTSRRTVGICLGHQIILNQLYGQLIKRSLYPLHGQVVSIKDNQTLSGIFEIDDSIKLQRYNSLFVDVDKESSLFNNTQLIFDTNDELLMAYESERIFTMQFHPESVGTSCSKAIFQALERFFR